MMQPRKVKWRKQHLPKVRSKVASSGNKLEFGRIFSNQIEAMRLAVVRSAGKKAKFWIRIFPHRPFTKKPAEVRRGEEKVMSKVGTPL
jgi:large subunit ribosomal protein L16